jgi:3-deoxy-D-manno-octulosonic-acid transferase
VGLANNSAARLSALERIYAVLSPYIFGPSLAVAYAGGASAQELRARTGRMPPAAGKAVWLHGASAGEMAAGARLVAALRQAGHHSPAIFTAANRAGVDYIARWAQPNIVAALAPWDVPAWVSRAFDQWRPAALFLIETELWPRLIFEAHRRGVPVLALSARIYPRDMARYSAIRSFIAPTLRRFSRILAQNVIERDRFIALGAPADRCVAAGNLKHLQTHSPADPARLRDQLGVDRTDPIVVFGSIHQQEIAFVVKAIARLRADSAGRHDRVRFIVAPRHLSSAGAIRGEAGAIGLRTALRSGELDKNWRLLVLDTMGELLDFYTVATVAVIGGGFAKLGGHNPLEAIEAGAPIFFGANFDHFEHEARSLTAVTPEALVSSPEQLAAQVRRCLEHEESRGRMLTRQRQTVPDAARITRCYLDEISPYLAADHA